MAPSLRKTLEPLCVLFGLLKIIENEAQLFEFGILKSEHFKWVKDLRDDYIVIINEYALGLVEVIH